MKYRFILLTITTLSLFFGAAATASNACVDEAIAKLLRVDRTSPRAHIERAIDVVLGRKLSESEYQALAKAVHIGSPELLSQAEVEAQGNVLAKHFNPEEITRMRRFGVLGNEIEVAGQEIPLVVTATEVNARPLGRKEIAMVRAGDKPLRYFLDLDDHLHVCEEQFVVPKDSVMVLKDTKTGNSYLVKESGELKWDKAAGKPKAVPIYTSELAGEDPEGYLERIKKENPELEIDRPKLPEQEKSKVLGCLEIMAEQGSARRFFIERVLTDNIVTSSGILITKGPQFFSKDPEEVANAVRVSFAETVANNVGLVAGSLVGAGILKLDVTKLLTPALAGTALNAAQIGKVVKPLVDLASKGAVSLGMTQIEKPIYRKIVSPEPGKEGAAEAVADFDIKYSSARIPINPAIDHYISQVLPMQLFDACRKDMKAVRVIFSPRAVRIYERGASTIIYHTLRKRDTGY